MKSWLLIIPALALSACATSSPTEVPVPRAEYLKMTKQTFISPTDGAIFRLSLGKMLGLHGNTGGITPIPDGISGLRYATASYYSINCIDGAGCGKAESSITEGSEHAIAHIKIQHESSSGRILVTEDISDGLACKRYILFTPNRSGYRIDYLAPKSEYIPELDKLPQMILMPKDRAWVDGVVIPISRIRKSKHPFSMGG